MDREKAIKMTNGYNYRDCMERVTKRHSQLSLEEIERIQQKNYEAWRDSNVDYPYIDSSVCAYWCELKNKKIKLR